MNTRLLRASRSTLVVVVCLVATAAAPHAARDLVLAPGDPAPRLMQRDLEGKLLTVSWAGSKVTVVNFWAPWCEPCRDEMPALQDLWARRADDGLAVFGVHMLGPVNEEIWGFLDEVGVEYPVLLGEVQTAQKWFVNLLPTTYLIRSDGTVARRYVGAEKIHLEAILQDVEDLLDDRPLRTLALPEEAEPASDDPGS